MYLDGGKYVIQRVSRRIIFPYNFSISFILVKDKFKKNTSQYTHKFMKGISGSNSRLTFTLAPSHFYSHISGK